jgi:hypothetical protein
MDTLLIVCAKMGPGDFISLAEILITALVGIWIAIAVQKRLATDRAVKDYFIAECGKINESYCVFFGSLYSGKLSSKYIAEWFKIMSSRIDIYMQFVQAEYGIAGDLLVIHNRIKHFVTRTEEFNSHYSKDSIKLKPTNQNLVLKLHSDFKISVTGIIIKINKASKAKPSK